MIPNNILFIVGGAFDGIEEIVKQRLGKKIIGFGANNKKLNDDDSYMQEIIAEDIQKFGLIPEFMWSSANCCCFGTFDRRGFDSNFDRT